VITSVKVLEKAPPNPIVLQKSDLFSNDVTALVVPSKAVLGQRSTFLKPTSASTDSDPCQLKVWLSLGDPKRLLLQPTTGLASLRQGPTPL